MGGKVGGSLLSPWRLNYVRRWWKTNVEKSLVPYRGSVLRRLLLLFLIVVATWMYRSDIRASFSSASAAESAVVTGSTDSVKEGGEVEGSVQLGASDARAIKVVEGGNRSLTLAPVEWKDDSTRYLMYFPLYGQLNNQVMSLINALVLAKMLGAVLVVPRVEAGFDSRFGSSSTHPGPFILGDYFDWNRIAQVQGIIHMDEFLALPAAAKAARQGNLVVTSTFNTRTLAKEKSYYPYDFFFRPTERSREEADSMKREIEGRLGIDSPKVGKCKTWFDAIEEAAKMDVKINGRIYIMSCMYQTITEDWGCQEDVPYWYEVRKHLVPRAEIRKTVSGWYDVFQAPVLVVHVRLLFKDETVLQTTLYDVIVETLSSGSNGTVTLSSFRTIYLAYGNRELGLLTKSGAIEFLQSKVPQVKIRACADMYNCASLGDKDMVVPKLTDWASELRSRDASLFDDIFRSHYSSAILDMWASVNSDVFIGRSSSTLSRNVGYWRTVFNSTKLPLPSYYYKALPTP